MAELLAVGSIFRPSPVGFNYVQQWTDLTHDNGSQTRDLYFKNGSAFVAANAGAGAWQRSARSVDTVSGIFSVVLRAPMSSYAYIGLNTQGGSPTYPNPRYARSPYAVTTSTVALNGQVSRVYELGVGKGLNLIWVATSSVSWAICDTGSAIVYKYSTDGVTWNIYYTSLAAYTPNQIYQIDVGVTYGDQNIMVEVYSSVI